MKPPWVEADQILPTDTRSHPRAHQPTRTNDTQTKHKYAPIFMQQLSLTHMHGHTSLHAPPESTNIPIS